MDVQKYIASGIIEEFVLGQLSDREANEVYSFAEQYPEIMAEINAIESAMGEFALSQAVAPPPDLLDKVMAKIAKEDGQRIAPPPPNQKAKAASTGWFSGALALGLIGSLCLSIYFAYWLNDAQTVNENLTSENIALSATIDTLEQMNRYRQHLVDLCSDSDFQQLEIAFLGNPLIPNNEPVKLFWNGNTDKVEIVSANLHPVRNYDYKLWVIIEGDPTPIFQGIFEHSPTDTYKVALQKLNQGRPVAFAFSLEKRGTQNKIVGPDGNEKILPAANSVIAAGEVPS